MLVNQTVTFKKLTYFLGFSLVNIKSGWKLLKFSKNSSSFCPHFHSRQKRCRQFILAILRVSQSVFLQNQSQLYRWSYMRIVVQIWSNAEVSLKLLDGSSLKYHLHLIFLLNLLKSRLKSPSFIILVVGTIPRPFSKTLISVWLRTFLLKLKTVPEQK